MFTKITFVVVAVVQIYMVNSQCCGSQTSSCGGCGVAPSPRGFQVQSISPISPVGLFIVSENQIEGGLSVEGQLPFLGAVALQGEVSNDGNADVCYSCGNGQIAITQEKAQSVGLGGCGCGCGSLF